LKIIVFYIAFGAEQEAISLGKQAIENKLAACANVYPIQSFYPWTGKLQEDDEYALMLKTFPEFIRPLQTFIENHHAYEVPCIMHWVTDVNDAYGEWMKGMVSITT